MEKLIQFKLREDYYMYGYNDGMNDVFDTSYLERSADGVLSYVSGFSQAKAEKIEKLKFQQTFNFRRI